MNATYILTAELDPDSFAWLDALRRDHFPADRNVLPAHLTMFHRLKLEQTARLAAWTPPKGPLPILFDAALLLGSGVAIHARSAELTLVRQQVRDALGGNFSRQDSQTWRPHVTIQNKVSAVEARRLHEVLNNDFMQRSGLALGLLLWEYLGGPWRLASRHPFGSV